MKLLPLLLPLPLLLLLLLPTTTTAVTTTPIPTTTTPIPTTTTTTTNTNTTTTTTNCTLSVDNIYNSTDVASKGITQLGIKLFQDLWAEKNILVSPYSVWSLLALVLTGAEGNTKEELRVTLGLGDGKDGLLDLLRKLDGSLENATTLDGQVSLDVAHRIYVQNGFSIKKCQKELSDLLVQLNLTQSVQAADTINEFVNTSTRGLISELISPDMLGPDTRLVALNAIYFKGSWTTLFPKNNTSPRPFYVTPEAEPVMVDTMFKRNMPVKISFSQKLDATVLQLSYSTGLFSMTILLPKVAGDAAFNTTINALTPTTLWEAIGQVNEESYDVYMPKFKIESKFQDDLKAALQKMGINDVFTGAADLSSFGDNLYVKHIAHKAVVNVDEEGTEAAAATGAVIAIKLKSEIRLNRPFLFFIHDERNILFMGAVRNP